MDRRQVFSEVARFLRWTQEEGNPENAAVRVSFTEGAVPSSYDPVDWVTSVYLDDVGFPISGGTWEEAGREADAAWEMLADASTPLQFAFAMDRMNNAMSSLITWLPGYNYESGRVDEV